MKKLQEYSVFHVSNGNTNFIGSHAHLGMSKRIIAKHLTSDEYKEGDKYLIYYPGQKQTEVEVVKTFFKYVCYLKGYKNSQIRVKRNYV